MHIPGPIETAFATTSLFAAVRASPIGYDNIPIIISAGNSYNDDLLIGFYVADRISYMTAGATTSGGAFSWNFHATSQQLVYNDTSSSDSLVLCYVVNDPAISSSAGPLECGSNWQPGYYYDAALLRFSSSSTIGFGGIESWWVCTVQNTFDDFSVPGTVVGVFDGNAEPDGRGLSDCVPIDSIALVPSASKMDPTSSSQQQQRQIIQDDAHLEERPEL